MSSDRPAPTPAADAHVFRPLSESVPIDLARLGAYLDGIGLPLDRNTPVRQFGTGLANVNYRLTAGGRPLVLRRPPGGELPPGAHDMAREHRILSRLWEVHDLAPRSFHLCEDRDVIGVPFQLIEYRPGLVIKGDDRTAFEGQPERARAMSHMLVQTLVSIHRVDCAAIALDTLGKPEGFIARTLKGWAGRGQRLDLAPETARRLAEVVGWLERQTVQSRTPTLLHSDFKLDNIIVHPATLAPVAIIDWDMGTRGDPLFDLATLLSYWVEPDDPPCLHALRQMPTAAPGFARRRDLLAMYAREMDLDISDWPVLRVLAILKLAVVLLQLFALYERGAATGSAYAALDQVATELLAYATDVAHGRAD